MPPHVQGKFTEKSYNQDQIYLGGAFMENIQTKLINKSKEAFCMAIELYNKPTIKYRAEGFALFICNAWELMLKAHMLNTMGETSIYHKDNPHRTLSLENCIQKVFTNNLINVIIMLRK